MLSLMPTMNYYQPAGFETLVEQNPFANDYADYEQGFDQWQQWAQQSQRQRRLMSGGGRSLLGEMVDPRVEQHMQYNIPEQQTKQRRQGNQQESRVRRRPSPLSRESVKSSQAGMADFYPVHSQQERHKKDHSVCSSTKATSESDDSSYNVNNNVLYPSADPAWEIPDHNDLQMTRTMVLEQEAMLYAMRLKHEQQHLAKQQQQPKREEPPNNHGSGKSINILPMDRVKRAMQRGESIRLLDCSGCGQKLLVTADLPLVYCPQCECFSHQQQQQQQQATMTMTNRF